MPCRRVVGTPRNQVFLPKGPMFPAAVLVTKLEHDLSRSIVRGHPDIDLDEVARPERRVARPVETLVVATTGLGGPRGSLVLVGSIGHGRRRVIEIVLVKSRNAFGAVVLSRKLGCADTVSSIDAGNHTGVRYDGRRNLYSLCPASLQHPFD